MLHIPQASEALNCVKMELVNAAFPLLKGLRVNSSQHGAAIINARKLSSALSAASSACDHISDWVLGAPEGTWVSMSVYSDGSYNVPAGLIYSFPLTRSGASGRLCKVFRLMRSPGGKLDATADELAEEKALACLCLS